MWYLLPEDESSFAQNIPSHGKQLGATAHPDFNQTPDPPAANPCDHRAQQPRKDCSRSRVLAAGLVRAASRRAHRRLAAARARAFARGARPSAPGGRAVPARSGQMELLKDLRSHDGISTRRGGGGSGMESVRCSSGPGSVPRAGTKARRAQSKAATRCRPLPCRLVLGVVVTFTGPCPAFVLACLRLLSLIYIYIFIIFII